MNPYINLFCVPTFINIFIILITLLNINHFADELRFELCLFRKKLKEEKIKLVEFNKKTNFYTISRQHHAVDESAVVLDKCFKNFVTICKKLDSFNKIYGIQILNFATVFLTLVYESLTRMFKEVIEDKHRSRHLQLIAIKLLNCANFLIFGILLIVPCFKFNLETEKVVAFCRKILIDLPQDARFLRLKFTFLLKHLEIRKPYFSAAGFFEVDFVMLVYILNGITSYLLVTLQFNN